MATPPSGDRVLSVLQVGANAHSKAVAFSHDPVPRLIARGFSAVLVEPQPFAAESLRKAYAHNSLVRVVQAAFCPDASATTVPLWFINGTKNLGSNESDVRCAGAAISGTASFSRAHVMQHQRFYKFTPSRCANCARELGRALRQLGLADGDQGRAAVEELFERIDKDRSGTIDFRELLVALGSGTPQIKRA